MIQLKAASVQPGERPAVGHPRSQFLERDFMKIHEYQGEEILRSFGVPVPRGIPAFTVQEAVEAAQKLGGPVWVVKAQIHAGGRGKGGGVKVAKSIEQVKELAGQILGMQLKTHQTGPEGQKVRRLYIEDGADIQKEYYVSVVTDRATFAYLADVYVLEAHRGHGLAARMVTALHDHPDLQGLRRWMLATSDAHGLYAALGWTAIEDSTPFMQRHFPDVYRQAAQ